MNRRTLKKHCQRAMRVLITDHGYTPDSFVMADGEETLDAPVRMERRFQKRGFLEPGPLPGTPLIFERTSYEYDEWEHSLPSDVLQEIETWNSLTEAEMEALFAPTLSGSSHG